MCCLLLCVAYCSEADKRAENDLFKPEEVQLINRQQQQTRDAEQRLNEALE